MSEKVETLEEQAEIARARLKRRFEGFSDRYSLDAFKQAGRQLNHGRAPQSSSILTSLTRSPASSALMALAAGQLYRSQNGGSQRTENIATGATAPITAQDDDDSAIETPVLNDPATQRKAISWAREHPFLSGATALAIGIGAGYVLINGRRRSDKAQ